MRLDSIAFLVFVIAFLEVNYFLYGSRLKAISLAVFNTVFLVSFLRNAESGLLLAAIVLFGYVTALLMQQQRPVAHKGLPVIIAGYLLFFVVIKKYELLLYLHAGGLLHHSVFIIGFSYILFKQIHCFIDARNGGMQNLDFLTYYNYLLGFYTLLAGPIQRYDDFVSELRGNEGKCVADKYFILQQISRILTGVIKFAVLARLFQVWGGHLGQLLAYHAGLLLAVRFVFAMYMYFFYIYLSFSGYCDIVIGVAALSGVRLPENFDRPYMARNQIEFWERWHMTLSAWIKDYLFNPFCKLLLSKWQGVDVLLVGILGYFVAFFIAGIWHGNTLNFVFFGVLLGAGVAAVKIYEGVLKKLLGKNLLQKYRQDRVIRFVATAVSLTYFTFCLLFFDNTPGTVIRVLRHVIGLS